MLSAMKNLRVIITLFYISNTETKVASFLFRWEKTEVIASEDCFKNQALDESLRVLS